MTAELLNDVSAFFSRVRDYSVATMIQVKDYSVATVNSIWSALTTKVNAVSKEIFSRINGAEPSLKAAGKAAQKAGDKFFDLGMRTAARAAMIAYRPDAKIAQHKAALQELIGNDDIIRAVHEAVPHLVNKLAPYLGDKHNMKKLVQSNPEMCQKMAEAKILETLVEVAKKTKGLVLDLEGRDQDHIVSTLVAKTFFTIAGNLELTTFHPEKFRKEMENIGQEFFGKMQKFVGTKIERALLDKERDASAVKFNQAQTIAIELFNKLGLELQEGGKPVSAESMMKGILKGSMKDGFTKLLFQMNEKLQSAQQKLSGSELGQIPLDEFVRDFCKSSAKEATDQIIGSVKPSEGAKKAIEAQKKEIADVMESLFSHAFKWVGLSTGLMDKKGQLQPEHSWLANLIKPFKAVNRHWFEIRAAEQQRSSAAKEEKLQEAFENIAEDFFSDFFAPSLARFFEPSEASREVDEKERADARKQKVD